MDAMGAARGRRGQIALAVDVMAIAAVLAGLAILALRLWQDVQSPAAAAGAMVMLAFGYVMADLLTGFVHWFCDTFFDETTPLVGEGADCAVSRTSSRPVAHDATWRRWRSREVRFAAWPPS